jgi:hypothetical protein
MRRLAVRPRCETLSAIGGSLLPHGLDAARVDATPDQIVAHELGVTHHSRFSVDSPRPSV